MSDDIAIRVENLSKQYPIFDKPRDRLKQMFLPRLAKISGLDSRRYFKEFWALRNISFEVRKGEAVGILGRNGAGKSTLLQIICGTLAASSGTVTVNGRVAALLELGSGFNPEFTGRENVFLSGAILGVGQSEMNLRFDEVTAFADIGEFIDQPVKTYSSGMLMRLAFAVNTCLSPDILIVDEALGVGDAPFQAKCFKRLRELISRGVSLLFVSHDVATVRSVCNRSLWLDNGRAEMWGEAKTVSKEYEKFCWRKQGVMMDPEASPDATEELHLERSQIDQDQAVTCKLPELSNFPNPHFINAKTLKRSGTGHVSIETFTITKKDGSVAAVCDYNELLHFTYLLKPNRNIDSEFILAVRFFDTKGNCVLSAHDIFNTHHLRGDSSSLFHAHFNLRLPLHHQEYAVTTGIFGFQGKSAFSSGVYDFGLAEIWEVVEEAAFVKVNPCAKMPLPGPVHFAAPLQVVKITNKDPL
jgi:lipopolysaccharide transport system ATP-binding protein